MRLHLHDELKKEECSGVIQPPDINDSLNRLPQRIASVVNLRGLIRFKEPNEKIRSNVGTSNGLHICDKRERIRAEVQ
jgi:hypothetical protein